MTATRRKYIIYGILVATVIWGIYNNPFASKEKTTDEGCTTEPASASVIENQQSSSISYGKSVPDQYGEWGHDPFPRKTPKSIVRERISVVETPDFKLSAISESGNKIMAIINGEIVQKGGEVDNWIVADISEDRVLMNRGAEKIELTLNRR